MKQITDTIVMIRPVAFRSNEQTAVNNFYQQIPSGIAEVKVQEKALEEFDAFVEKLRSKGIRVVVIEDMKDNDTPDSIFPNNWISFHENKTVVVYPMFAENRRLERRLDILDVLEDKGLEFKQVIDYTSAEEAGLFLEGTGSLLLDRQNRIAYCALSPRADEELFFEFCEELEFTPVVFHAYQTVNGKRELIYHTNVMMALTEELAIVCLDCIDDLKEKKNLVSFLKHSGKKIVAISEDQVANFAGNMLQLRNREGKKFTVMSEAAFQCLKEDQKEALASEAELVHSDLATIEKCGGGSARCMMAEVFYG